MNPMKLKNIYFTMTEVTSGEKEILSAMGVEIGHGASSAPVNNGLVVYQNMSCAHYPINSESNGRVRCDDGKELIRRIKSDLAEYNQTILTPKAIDNAIANTLLPQVADAVRRIKAEDFYNKKDTNPKESVGIKKWRYFSTIPLTVICELGIAMLEGARKYGRHNYRVSGVKSSVYIDAAMGHITQWYEGEDVDKDSGLSHLVKAMACLVIIRDAMIQGKLNDDRPPAGNLDAVRTNLQKVVDELFEKYPDAKDAYINGDTTLRTS